MSGLARYLCVLFLARWGTVTLGMLGLVSLLDSLGNADLLPAGAGMAERLGYMALRLPVLFDRIFLFALFLGVLLTFVSLIRRGELVALTASGISALGQVRLIAPAVLIAAAGAALIVDQAAPPAARALERWLGTGAFEQPGATDAAWLAEPGHLVEIEEVRDEALRGLTFFERGERGVAAVVTAASAERVPGGWRLTDPVQERYDGADRPVMTEWITPQTPRSLRQLLAAPRDLSIRDQKRLADMRGSGSRPSGAYTVWSLHRLTLPLAALGFLAFAAPMMQRLGRRSTGDLALIGGLLAGFMYMIVDGVLKTLAEAGSVPALWAAGLPLALLFALAARGLINAERAP